MPTKEAARKTKKRIAKMRRKLKVDMAKKSAKIDEKAAKLRGKEKIRRAKKG